jgi:ABC-type multidrug transport system permease subunit
VYYPTQVIPSWLQELSKVLPLTYGLRALRQAALLNVPFSAVARDVSILAIYTAVLLGAGALTLAAALRYARRTGSLSHY